MDMNENGSVIMSENMKTVISKLLKNLNFQQHNVDISLATKQGENFTGSVLKVAIKGCYGKENTATLHLITKCGTRNQSFRLVFAVKETYSREVCIYSKILCAFEDFQKEKGVVEPFKSYARYYDSSLKDSEEVIVLEDMSQYGFRLPDRRLPLDYPHVVMVVRELGKLHAISFALRDQKPELFKNIYHSTMESYFKNLKFSDNLVKYLYQSHDKALKSLDPIKHKVAYNKFKDFKDHMIQWIVNTTQTEAAGQYGVVVHGDCWIANLLFKYGNSVNSSNPTELCFVDWQLSHMGSPALDLSTFIFTCTDQQLRSLHYDDIIHEYYDSLSNHLRELGSNPNALFPYEILREHLKEFSVYALYLVTGILNLVISDSDERRDIESFTDDRYFTDFIYESRNSTKYTNRIRGIILDYVNLGYTL